MDTLQKQLEDVRDRLKNSDLPVMASIVDSAAIAIRTTEQERDQYKGGLQRAEGIIAEMQILLDDYADDHAELESLRAQLKGSQSIDRSFIEDCLIAYSAHCYFDGAEGLRNKIDEQIQALSAPIPAQQSQALPGPDFYVTPDGLGLEGYASISMSHSEGAIPVWTSAQPSPKRPPPCENLCEAKAFEIEIRQLKAETERLKSSQQSPAVAVPDSFVSLLAAIKQYSNGEVIKVPDSIKTEEEFFSWLKTCDAPSPRITEQDAREIAESLILVGFTNGHQIEYAKTGEGAFYSDSENGCIIPLYMLKTHEHRIETSKETPLPKGCDLCNVATGCDGSC